jgi:hypothetical protein
VFVHHHLPNQYPYCLTLPSTWMYRITREGYYGNVSKSNQVDDDDDVDADRVEKFVEEIKLLLPFSVE